MNNIISLNHYNSLFIDLNKYDMISNLFLFALCATNAMHAYGQALNFIQLKGQFVDLLVILLCYKCP